jgi:rRNA maturation protein Nop10
MPGNYGAKTPGASTPRKPPPSSPRDKVEKDRRNLLKGVVKQMIRK